MNELDRQAMVVLESAAAAEADRGATSSASAARAALLGLGAATYDLGLAGRFLTAGRDAASQAFTPGSALLASAARRLRALDAAATAERRDDRLIAALGAGLSAPAFGSGQMRSFAAASSRAPSDWADLIGEDAAAQHFLVARGAADLRALAIDRGSAAAAGRASDAALASAARLWRPDAESYGAADAAARPSEAGFLLWYAVGASDDGCARPDDGRRRRSRDTLRRWLERVNFGAPSADPDEARFAPTSPGQGAMSPALCCLIAVGLAEQGDHALAETLRRGVRQAIVEGGFRAFFDPVSGAGLGAPQDACVAAVWLAWASPRAGAVIGGGRAPFGRAVGAGRR